MKARKEKPLPNRPNLGLVVVVTTNNRWSRRDVMKLLRAYLAGFEHVTNGPLSVHFQMDFVSNWINRQGFTRFLRAWGVKVKLDYGSDRPGRMWVEPAKRKEKRMK